MRASIGVFLSLLFQPLCVDAVKPIAYFSNVEILPLKNENLQIYFQFHCPLSYAEKQTQFTIQLDSYVIASFSVIPGMTMQHEVLLPKEKIKPGQQVLSFLAESSVCWCRDMLSIETQRHETYSINEVLQKEKELEIANALFCLEPYGQRNYVSEKFEFLFEEAILSHHSYWFDLSYLAFSYQLRNYPLSYERAELLIYGTSDDFPRLLFDENEGGYLFPLQIEKKEETYQFSFTESFFYDAETMMISRASGDYFNETDQFFVSRDLRKVKDDFPFRITIYGAGSHASTLIYEGTYRFVHSPIGACFDSEVCLLEGGIDEKLSENYEPW